LFPFLHEKITVEATSSAGAVVTYTAPDATDNIDATTPATCIPASGSTFPIGITSVTCNKADTAGNSAIPTNFDIKVEDTTAPSIPEGGSPNGTTIDTNNFDFTWDAATDISAITYKYQTSLNPAETSGVLTTGLWESDILPSNSIQSSGASDGTWYWQVRAIDSYGNTSAWSEIWNVKIDTTAPLTTDAGTDADWHNEDVTVTFACGDGTGSGCDTTYYTTDGVDPTTSSSSGNSFTLSSEGEYTIKYFSVDNADNTETVKTATNTVKIDKTKPESVITTFGLPDGGSVTTPTWNGRVDGTASDDRSGVSLVKLEITRVLFGASLKEYWNGSSWQSSTTTVNAAGSTSWNYQLPTPEEGTYQVTSHAIDNAGNVENTYSITIIYDKTIPEVTLAIDPLNPEGDNNWYLTNPTITLTANDNNGSVDRIEYQLNGTGGAWIAYASPVTLDDGIWQFYYRSIDTASNASGIGLKNVKVDTTDPDNVNSFQAEYRPGTTDVRLTWNVNDNDIKDVYIYRGGSRTFTVNSGSRIVINDNNDESYNDNNVNPGQTYFYKAVARDDAGNNSSASVIKIVIPSGGTAPAVSTALGTEVVPEGTILGTETNTEGQPTVTEEPQSSDSFNQGTETTNTKPEVLGEDVQKDNQSIWGKWWFWLILLGVFSLPVWLLFKNKPTE